MALFAIVSTANAASVILNEYNSGGASDVQGDWFEIVVVGNGSAGDFVNMQGWEFQIDEVGTDGGTPGEGPGVGRFQLSGAPYWSAVQAGTIITFHEDNSLAPAGAGRDTSILAVNNFGTQGWAHTNVWVQDPVYINTGFLGHDPSYPINQNGTQITIRRGNSTVEFGPAGEGVVTGVNVSESEVFKLEANPTIEITRFSPSYNDGSSSTFGAPNTWDTSTPFPKRQDFAAFIIPEPASLLLAGAAGVGILCVRRRRR